MHSKWVRGLYHPFFNLLCLQQFILSSFSCLRESHVCMLFKISLNISNITHVVDCQIWVSVIVTLYLLISGNKFVKLNNIFQTHDSEVFLVSCVSFYAWFLSFLNHEARFSLILYSSCVGYWSASSKWEDINKRVCKTRSCWTV